MHRRPRCMSRLARSLLPAALALACAGPLGAQTTDPEPIYPPTAANPAVHGQSADVPSAEAVHTGTPVTRIPSPSTPVVRGPAPGTPAAPAAPAAGDPAGDPAGAAELRGPAPTEPPMRARPPATDPAIDSLSAGITELRSELQRLQDDNDSMEAANRRLTELNAQLRQEVESLALELQGARDSASRRWLLYGAGLLLLGLLGGIVIKTRPRRSAWS